MNSTRDYSGPVVLPLLVLAGLAFLASALLNDDASRFVTALQVVGGCLYLLLAYLLQRRSRHRPGDGPSSRPTLPHEGTRS